MKHFVSIIGTDCTNGGVTSGQDHAHVIAEKDVPQLGHDAIEGELPLLVFLEDQGPTGHLVIKHGGSIHRVKAVPLVNGKPQGGMFGGHFLYTSDSRYPYENPVPVFDRFE